jgi:ribosome-binding factor A
MAKPIRRQQIATLLQQTLGEIFVQETVRLFGRAMITVTEVQMVNNLGLAKVYLSLMLTDDKKNMLKTIIQHKNELRGLLGKKLGSKLRRIPDIEFYIDNSIEHAVRIERLMNDLELSTDTDDGLLTS